MFSGTGMFEYFRILVLSTVLTRPIFSPSLGLTNVVLVALSILALVMVNEIAPMFLVDPIFDVEELRKFSSCLYHSAFCVLW